jgi:hypothetical protein
MFGGKRIFFGNTGRIVVEFSVILFHFSRNEQSRTDQLCFQRSTSEHLMGGRLREAKVAKIHRIIM